MGIEKLCVNHLVEGSIIVDKDSSITCIVNYNGKKFEQTILRDSKLNYDYAMDLSLYRICRKIVSTIAPSVYLNYLYNTRDFTTFLTQCYLQISNDKENEKTSVYKQLINYYSEFGNSNNSFEDSVLKYVELLLQNDKSNYGLFNLKGQALLSLGDTDKALSSFSKILTLTKTYPAVYLELGDIKASQQNIDSAFIFYRIGMSLLRETDENFSIGLLNKGLLYAEIGDIDSASYCFDKWRKLNPRRDIYNGVWTDIPGYYKSVDEALTKVRKTYQTHPLNKYICYYLGIRYLQDFKDANIDSAKYYFKKSIATDPDFSEAYFGFATALVQDSDYIGASQYFKIAYRQIGYNKDLFTSWINCLLLQKNYVEAKEMANIGYNYEPNNSEIVSLLAISCAGLKNNPMANYYFEKAIEITPDNTFVLTSYLKYLLDEYSIDEAFRYTNILLEDYPKNYEIYEQILNIYNKTDQIERTESILKKMKDVFTDSFMVNKRLGIYYYSQGDYLTALNYLVLYTDSIQNDMEGFWFKSYSEFELFDDSSSVKDITYMLDKGYRNPDIRLLRGKAYFDLGDDLNAVRDFDTAASLGSYNCNSLFLWKAALENLTSDKKYLAKKEFLEDRLRILRYMKKSNCDTLLTVIQNTGTLAGSSRPTTGPAAY